MFREARHQLSEQCLICCIHMHLTYDTSNKVKLVFDILKHIVFSPFDIKL